MTSPSTLALVVPRNRPELVQPNQRRTNGPTCRRRARCDRVSVPDPHRTWVGRRAPPSSGWNRQGALGDGASHRPSRMPAKVDVEVVIDDDVRAGVAVLLERVDQRAVGRQDVHALDLEPAGERELGDDELRVRCEDGDDLVRASSSWSVWFSASRTPPWSHATTRRLSPRTSAADRVIDIVRSA